MRPLSEKLTNEEQERNKHGPALLFHYSPSPKGPYEAPAYFAAISNHHAVITPVPRESFLVPPEMLIKGLCPNVRLDVYFPGFPTLKHIPHKVIFLHACSCTNCKESLLTYCLKNSIRIGKDNWYKREFKVNLGQIGYWHMIPH